MSSLDEFPLFRTDVIEALRQPLESGEISVARRDESVTLPARGMIVLAANPCPCGDYHPDARASKCQCKEVVRRAYRDRVTGPLADRIDINRHVAPARPHAARDVFAPPEPSDAIRARVEAARLRQDVRYRGCAWRLNGQVPGPVLSDRWPLPGDAQRLVADALYDGGLSRRGATRVHRLAWTVADLQGHSEPTALDVDTALRLRSGQPLLLATLDRRVAG